MMSATRRGASLLRRIVSLRDCSFRQTATLYSKFEGWDYSEWLHKIRHTPSDPKALRARLRERMQNDVKLSQQFDEELRARVGVELSVAHFIVNRGGAVKFVDSGHWVELPKRSILGRRESEYKLPETNVPGYKVEAVDASFLPIMYDSFDMLEDLGYVKYLNVSYSPFFDDWCFERLQPISETLLVLDVSGCPQVTERGLATVHKLPKLRRLLCNDMPRVKNPAFVKLLLEEMVPNTVVEGLADYTDPAALEKAEPIEEPVLTVPPSHIAEMITGGEWIHVDDLLEEEEKEKEGERKLLPSGTEPQYAATASASKR